jgi:predicted transcriptional regulator
MTAATTIKVDLELKENLDKLKLFPRETYNEVVSRLVDMAYDQEPLSDETINRIEEALEDLKRGKYYTQEEVEAELGLR